MLHFVYAFINIHFEKPHYLCCRHVHLFIWKATLFACQQTIFEEVGDLTIFFEAVDALTN
jgi:hypothetical protein